MCPSLNQPRLRFKEPFSTAPVKPGVVHKIDDDDALNRIAANLAVVADTHIAGADKQQAVQNLYDEGMSLRDKKMNLITYFCFQAAQTVTPKGKLSEKMTMFLNSDVDLLHVRRLLLGLLEGDPDPIGNNIIQQFQYIERLRNATAKILGDDPSPEINSLFRRILPNLTLT